MAIIWCLSDQCWFSKFWAVWQGMLNIYSHKFIHDYDPTMHHVINHINRMKNLPRGFGPIWRSKLNWPKAIAACSWRSTCRNKIVAWASLWRFKQTCATLGSKRSACTKEGGYWMCYFWCGMPLQILATCCSSVYISLPVSLDIVVIRRCTTSSGYFEHVAMSYDVGLWHIPVMLTFEASNHAKLRTKCA